MLDKPIAEFIHTVVLGRGGDGNKRLRLRVEETEAEGSRKICN